MIDIDMIWQIATSNGLLLIEHGLKLFIISQFFCSLLEKRSPGDVKKKSGSEKCRHILRKD